jgi:glycine/D-amino acid oxidase-like deaminating enzyme
MTDTFYPRDADGYPAGNYLLARDEDRPRFADAPLVFARRVNEPAIVLIGAGFIGVSAALHLAEMVQATGHATRIVLLEQDRVASGPTGKGAGHVCGLQATEETICALPAPARPAALLGAAADAKRLVHSLIARLGIPCDVRRGYVTINADGSQTTTEGGDDYGIDPYPYALALAKEAARLGVEIVESTAVTGLTATPDGYTINTVWGTLMASCVLACGGHRMAQTIPLLAPLRRGTTELRVSTIRTGPLPDTVLRQIMPAAAGRRFPFANVSADVAYGSIDRTNRMIFGAHATAWGKPDPVTIFGTLTRLLPMLPEAFRAATGTALGWQPLVVAEPLCFTRNYLPNVGALPSHPRVLFAHALGGHGLAVGTMLGQAAADKLWGLRTGDATCGARFDTFAAVPHGWLPPSQPWRRLTTGLGLFLRRNR